MNNIKEIISSRRKEIKMTQLQLAQKLNISDKTVSKWETGASYPDITLINALAKALEISVSQLLDADEFQKKTLTEKEEYDHKAITKFKLLQIIAYGVLLVGAVIFVFWLNYVGIRYLSDRDKTVFAILSILMFGCFIASAIILLSSFAWFGNLCKQKFYTKKYDDLLYKCELIPLSILMLITLMSLLAPTAMHILVEITILILLLACPILPFFMARKCNKKIKTDKANKILLVVMAVLFLIMVTAKTAYACNAQLLLSRSEQLVVSGLTHLIIVIGFFITTRRIEHLNAD